MEWDAEDWLREIVVLRDDAEEAKTRRGAEQARASNTLLNSPRFQSGAHNHVGRGTGRRTLGGTLDAS